MNSHIRFRKSLISHIAYVQKAAKMLGLPEYVCENHDKSKWLQIEFDAYANWHKGQKNNPEEYAYAWLHHIHYNRHHWQHWIFPDGYTPKGSSVENGIIEMPKVYVEEMVCDLLAREMINTGNWDMTDWLKKNVSKMMLHSKTRDCLDEILGKLGY